MDILDDMGVSKLSAKKFLKVNYSFKEPHSLSEIQTRIVHRKCAQMKWMR